MASEVPHPHQCQLVFLQSHLSWHQRSPAFTQSGGVSCRSHQPQGGFTKARPDGNQGIIAGAKRRRRMHTWARLSSLNSNAHRNQSHSESDLYPPQHTLWWWCSSKGSLNNGSKQNQTEVLASLSLWWIPLTGWWVEPLCWQNVHILIKDGVLHVYDLVWDEWIWGPIGRPNERWRKTFQVQTYCI